MSIINLTKEKANQLSVEYVDMIVFELEDKLSYFDGSNFVVRQETATMMSYVEEMTGTELKTVILTQVKELAPIMTLSNGRSIMGNISEELFEPRALNWGRIVALHLFVKLMLIEFKIGNRLDDNLKEAMRL